MVKRIITCLILVLGAINISGPSFAEDGRIGEISAGVIKHGCSVQLSTQTHTDLDDPLSSAPFDVLASWRCLDGENLFIDKYEINGANPEILTVFFWQNNNIIVLVKWSINSLAADYSGDYYRVFIYGYTKNEHGSIISKNEEAMKEFPAGWDGRNKNGTRLRYHFKDAASIQEKLSKLEILMTSTKARVTSFSGAWDWSAAPRSRTFSIDLKQDGRKIYGQYCAISLNGARIDCDDKDNPNILGQIDSSGKLATVEFSSYFGAKQGRATMRISKGRIIWKITIDPHGGYFYAPRDAVLDRKR